MRIGYGNIGDIHKIINISKIYLYQRVMKWLNFCVSHEETR